MSPRSAALALGAAVLGWAGWGLLGTAEQPSPAPAALLAMAGGPLDGRNGASGPNGPSGPSGPAEAALLSAHAPVRAVTAAPVQASTDLAPLLVAPEAELRATLQTALATRAQGGRLYARALARRCDALAGLSAAPAPDFNDARHQRATARQAALEAGCGQLAPAEWLALVNVAADEPASGDPLLTVQQSDLDEDALLRAVFERPDALLLDELGERLLLRRIGGQPTLYFDGERFDTEPRLATMQAALRLLPCQFGLACDERDPQVWLACLRGEGCAASRTEQAPPAAQALAVRLAAALRGRELARFLPPSH